MQGRYIVVVDQSESDDGTMSLMAIHNERQLCFHVAVSHVDVEDAKAVCAQTVLFNSTPDNCPLYYAVYNISTQMVHFCLCDPQEETYEDVARCSMRSHASQMAAWLRAYVSSNVQVVQQ
jgi:hypothetical protein